MTIVEYEELYAVLITVFAALAALMGGLDVPTVDENRLGSKG